MTNQDSGSVHGRAIHMIFGKHTTSPTMLSEISSPDTADTIKCPEWLKSFLEAYSPSLFRHWAVRVGDDVWELWKESGINNYKQRVWSEVEQYYHEDQIFMGLTEWSNDQITQLAEDLTEASKTYDVVSANCQCFAKQLIASIPKTNPIPDSSTGGRHKIMLAFTNFVNAFAWKKGDHRAPMEINDIVQRARTLLHVLTGEARRQVIHLGARFIGTIVKNVMDYFVSSTGSFMGWLVELAEPLAAQGWVVLCNGASVIKGLSAQILVTARGVSFEGVINFAVPVIPNSGLMAAIGLVMIAIFWWKQGGKIDFSDTQLLRVGRRSLEDLSSRGSTSRTQYTVIRVAEPPLMNDEPVIEEKVVRRPTYRARVVNFN